jgi:hypothetical protein
MVRSVPVGFRVDLDLRTRFPELQAAQEQAIRRQIDTHASVLTPGVRRNIPEVPLRLNLAINGAFARLWGRAGPCLTSRPGFWRRVKPCWPGARNCPSVRPRIAR